MSLTSDDFEEFVSSDPDDDETVPLGQALSELGLDVEVDSVEAVRDVRALMFDPRLSGRVPVVSY
jgi:hypothetical protein